MCNVLGKPTVGFASWAEVLQHIASGARVYYKAPLDYCAVRVNIAKVFKNGKVRIAAPNRDCDPFTADEGHLDRFRKDALTADEPAPLATPRELSASEGTMYKIVRNYFDRNIPKRTIKTGLTLKQAQAHCRDPETSSSTCKGKVGRARTRKLGAWFDGYQECKR